VRCFEVEENEAWIPEEHWVTYFTTPYPMETMSNMKSERLFRPELRIETNTNSAMAKVKGTHKG